MKNLKPEWDMEDMVEVTKKFPRQVNANFYGTWLDGKRLFQDFNDEIWALDELDRWHKLEFFVTAVGASINNDWCMERTWGTYKECMEYIKHEEKHPGDDKDYCLFLSAITDDGDTLIDEIYCTDVLNPYE